MRRPSTLLILIALLAGLSPAPSTGAEVKEADIVLKKHLAGGESGGADGLGEYTVRKGDSLSGIIDSMGIPPSRSDEYLDMLRELNPSLKNPDLIHPGQKLILPTAGEKAVSTGGKVTGAVPPPSHEKDGDLPPLSSLRNDGTLLTVLDWSFLTMDESLSTEGTLTLPLPASGTVTLDNSAFPLLNLSSGRAIILDFDGGLTKEWKEAIEDRWPQYRIVEAPGDIDLRQLVGAILDESGYHSVAKDEPLSIGRTGRLRLVPDFLVAKNPDSLLDGTLYLIAIEASAAGALPQEIKEIAREHLITVVEIYPGAGKDEIPVSERRSRWGGPKVTASDYRSLFAELAPTLGLTVRDPSSLDLGAPGDTVPKQDLLLAGKERSCLVVFGDHDPSLPELLAAEGVGYLPVGEGDSFGHIVGGLLNFFEFRYSGPLVEFYRPDGRYSLAVPGFYLLREGRPLLLTGEEIGPKLKSFLVARGIEVVTYVLF